MDFWREEISPVFITGFHASRERFVDLFLGKESIAKTFSLLERNLLSFVETFRQIREKCITASKWIFLSKKLFFFKVEK